MEALAIITLWLIVSTYCFVVLNHMADWADRLFK